MPRETRRTQERYVPPAQNLVHVTNIEELIRGTRTIIPDQQPRVQLEKRIWCAGDVSLLRNKCVAVVGTREVSSEGKMRARRLAQELAQSGVVVISGLAKGVDTEALTAAIEAGGKVVAVIGTPIDRAYPAENTQLQEQIYREHLLISQFSPGSRVYPSNFPERNKLMAALSDGTAIIEAGDTSGTLHQAAECLRLKRWLFIAKNVIDNPTLEWPKRFRHYENVITFTSTADVLRAIGIQ